MGGAVVPIERCCPRWDLFPGQCGITLDRIQGNLVQIINNEKMAVVTHPSAAERPRLELDLPGSAKVGGNGVGILA